MRVFITGATGWIGSATVDELVESGHDVIGLARSDRSADDLRAKGVRVQRGGLDDRDALREGAEGADAVVHLGNKHDWSDPAGTARTEREAVRTMAEVLVGRDAPFVVASGIAGLAEGRPGLETDRSPFVGPDAPRGGSEALAFEYADRGVRTIAARFAPTVHGAGDPQFMALIVAAARSHGFAAYVGDGRAAWSAVHRLDAARLITTSLTEAPVGTVLHAVAEEAVPTRDIAAAVGAACGVPVRAIGPDDAVDHFGFVGSFFGMDLVASSALTRERFGWAPTGPTLLEDIAAGAYEPGPGAAVRSDPTPS